ncbi:MAG TPA: hypothetical protein VJJ28_00220 [Candidatus Paceibacterota bacterium]
MKSSISKKITLLFSVFSLCIFFGISTVQANTDTQIEAINPKPVATRPPLGEKIKADIENRIEKNKEMRNDELGQRQEIKNIKQTAKQEIKDLRLEKREEIKLIRASSTDMFKRTAEIRKEIAKKMEVNKFEIRKNALVRELKVAISNLNNINIRIESRIIKAESEGRNMIDAKELLVTANNKLETAKAEVQRFENISIDLNINNTNNTVASTSEIDLVKPRQLGDTAIKSVREAKSAFQKVVNAIARAMGLGNTASTTTVTN